MIEPDFSTNFNRSDAAADNGATLGADVPSELKPALDEALDFLRGLYPTGPWALTGIHGDTRQTETRTFGPNSADRAARWIAAQQKWQRNIYFALNTPLANVAAKKATKIELDVVIGKHLDCDLPAGRDAEWEAKTLEKLRKSEPNYIVFSGGGYQAAWLFEQPFRALEIDPETGKPETVAVPHPKTEKPVDAHVQSQDSKRVELLNKQVIEEFKEFGSDEATHNIDRISVILGHRASARP